MTLRPALLPLALLAALAALAATPAHAQSARGEPSTAPKTSEPNAPVDNATPMPKPGAPATIAAKPKTMQEILDASAPSDWRPLDPQNTLYMELESGRVIIELAPQFAPAHVANIRALAKGHFWDGLSIYRVHENFVAQFGDADADDQAKARAFPAGALTKLPAEFTAPAAGVPFTRLPDVDGWAPEVGFSNGLPAARDPAANIAWPAHCYATLGAGRGGPPDSSNGAELYVVIGQSPRQLDRNITTVGRVVQGMEHLTALPRGPQPMGFYADATLRTTIRAIRLLADVPVAERENLEVFRTDTPAWDALIESRRNRSDDWYVHPAGHIDLCNVPVPVRPVPAAK
jgi:peptidylprolyl isomerase